jgi:hypothetical protein
MKRELRVTLTKSGAISKEDFIALWENIQPNQVINPDPIAYKHEGSTIDEDGIRICGTIEFIQSVISNLTQMLRFDGRETRLSIACSQITDRYTGKVIKGKYRCSIQVHERGRYAVIFGNNLGDYREKHKGSNVILAFNQQN